MANIHILGIPMDLGAGRRGVDMGPSALRLAKLADNLREVGHTLTDLGNIEPAIQEVLAEDIEDTATDDHLVYVDNIADTCTRTYTLAKGLPTDTFPIFLGGDHSISMGTVAAVVERDRAIGKTGVVWIDAHSDIHTPKTSPSGNVHGMPIGHLLGRGDPRLLNIWGGGAVIQPADIVYVGLRSIDAAERVAIHQDNITAYTMKDIDRHGIANIVTKVLEHCSNYNRIHVSFDADALDPSIAPGVGTPVAGGLSYRETHLMMEMLAEAQVVTSLDLVEVNPILDFQNQTAKVMVEMASSLLGKTIL